MNIYKIKVTDLEGKIHGLEGPEGYRLTEVIRDNDIHIKAECGGCASCSTCHIYVKEEWLPKLVAPSDEEKKLLSGSYYLKENSRLSCQILLNEKTNGIEVTITPDCE